MLYVRIKEYDTDAIFESIGPVCCDRTAEKIERGVNINLNHARFYTITEEIADTTSPEAAYPSHAQV